MTTTKSFSPVFPELPHITPVFVEFDRVDGLKDWFIGESLEAILADTNGGTLFGFREGGIAYGDEYTGHRVITEDYIRSLKLDYVDSGLNSVRSGRVGSRQGFKLAGPSGHDPVP